MAPLTVLHRWTMQLLVLWELKRAPLLYLRAAGGHLAEPLHPSAVEEMECYSRERQRRTAGSGRPWTNDLSAAGAFGTPRFRALYRHWLVQIGSRSAASSSVTRGESIYRWELDEGEESVAIAVNGSLRLDDEDLVFQAALDGAGLAIIDGERAAPCLEDGRFVAVRRGRRKAVRLSRPTWAPFGQRQKTATP